MFRLFLWPCPDPLLLVAQKKWQYFLSVSESRRADTGAGLTEPELTLPTQPQSHAVSRVQLIEEGEVVACSSVILLYWYVPAHLNHCPDQHVVSPKSNENIFGTCGWRGHPAACRQTLLKFLMTASFLICHSCVQLTFPCQKTPMFSCSSFTFLNDKPHLIMSLESLSFPLLYLPFLFI